MVLTIALFALVAALACAGFWLMARRMEHLERELERLQRALEARAAAPAKLRAANSGRVVVFADQKSIPALAEAAPRPRVRAWLEHAKAWRPPQFDLSAQLSFVRADVLKLAGLAALACVPALGFALAVAPALIVAIGLAIGAFMMLLAARVQWPQAGWAALLAASGWAGAGFALNAAHAAPVLYSSFVAFAGLAGLAYAAVRKLTPGALLTLAMAAAVLALGAATDMAGPPGLAFGLIVTGGAIVGAHALKLDVVHLGAFVAGLIGLYVLSGQASAAIWFTTGAAWFGALFLGIAAVRAPELGARGAHIAGAGALAPLIAIGALHIAQQGLPERIEAAGAFAGAALALAGVIALAANRRERGLSSLKLTLWMLSTPAFIAVALAIMFAAPAPLAAGAFAALALGLTLLNGHLPAAPWRAFACMAVLLAALQSWTSARQLLDEAPGWAPFALIAAGQFAPALLAGRAARHAHREQAPFTAAMLELFAVGATVASANLALRVLGAHGAVLSAPIGFVEGSGHISVWLIAALLLASRRHLGATRLRSVSAYALGAAALAASALATVLWLTPHWSTRAAETGLLAYTPFGFVLLALLFGAHWALWRGRAEALPTRLAFGAGALMGACALTLQTLHLRGSADGVVALIGALSFAAAIVVNFAPGVAVERDA